MEENTGWLAAIDEVDKNDFSIEETDELRVFDSIFLTDSQALALQNALQHDFYVNPLDFTARDSSLKFMLDTEGNPLFPSHCVATIYGESDTRKSFLLQTAVAEHWGIMIQLESGPTNLIKRLEEMHFPHDAHSRYIFPTSAVQLKEIVAKLVLAPPTIVGIDSFTPLIALFDGDNNSDIDTQMVTKEILHPLRDAGHCVIYLDHQSKKPKNTRFATGSQNKKAQVDIALTIKYHAKRDRYEVFVAKDRDNLYSDRKINKTGYMGYVQISKNLIDGETYPPFRAKLVPKGASDSANDSGETENNDLAQLITQHLKVGAFGKEDLAQTVGGNRAKFNRTITELVEVGTICESPGLDRFNNRKRKVLRLPLADS